MPTYVSIPKFFGSFFLGLPPYHAEKRTSVLFVSVSFMILMLISLAWLVFYYIQRFRYIHAKDQRERKVIEHRNNLCRLGKSKQVIFQVILTHQMFFISVDESG